MAPDNNAARHVDMETLVALCRSRGFIFQSSEIYGGINGFWDYGPLGVELKNNIKAAWWQDMVRNPPPGPDGQEITMVGLDCSIIMNPRVWEASGHVAGFSDPMVDCKACKARFRADQLIGIEIARDPFRDTEEGPKQFYLSGLGTKEDVFAEKQKEIQKLSKAPSPSPRPIITVLTYLEIPDAARSHVPCPECRQVGHLTEPRTFNLMFQTFIGALQDASSVAYLRPETAQGIFANFKNVLSSSRVKLPFGIAQIGKAFRNEINPRNYTFRSREFEQMEIEFFCHPAESMKWYQYWRDVRKAWYTQLGIKSDNLRPREQGKDELAHYSIGTTDIEYLFPFSNEPQELEGVAHRGAYDLTAHQTHSKQDLSYFDEEAWERDKASRGTNSFQQWAKTNPPAEELAKYRFIPHVVEPSAGADRFTLAVLCEAYTEEKVKDETRTVMKFHPRLAPIKAAIFPLVNKDGMPDVAQRLYRELKAEFNVFYDDKGAVGRRYRRQDEAGTPFCITIDGETLQNQSVTLRERDSMQQRRVAIGAVAEELRKLLRPTR
jgi:glycyl-tRNA synthetase